MKEFKTTGKITSMTNKELLRYKKELEMYKDVLSDHIDAFVAECKYIRSLLGERLIGLELDLMEAELDRQDSEWCFNDAQTRLN